MNMEIWGSFLNLLSLYWIHIIFGLLFLVILLVVANFLDKRGAVETSPKTEASNPKLVRITQRKVVAGICAGFAWKFGVPRSIVRALWLLMMIPLSGTPVIAYFACWALMPKADKLPEDYDTRTDGY